MASRINGHSSKELVIGKAAFCTTLLALCAVSASFAQTLPPIEATPTNLVGNADRMISYRYQAHSWQTADGFIHVLVNTGIPINSGGNGLTLYSYDPANPVIVSGAVTWTSQLSLANTGQTATADGVLVNDALSLVYSTNELGSSQIEGGSILYSVLNYNETTHTWSANGSPEKIFDTSIPGNTLAALNPSIAIDANHQIWCSYVSEDAVASSPSSNIKLFVRKPGASGWQDTGLVFGPKDNATANIERSGRLMTLSDGIGMLYSVHQAYFWTRRLNTASDVTTPWTAPKAVFASARPFDNNPYMSHFSTVTDTTSGKTHLALVDHGKLLYFSYLNSTHAWSRPQVLTADISATYPAVALVNGTLEIFVNSLSNTIYSVWGYQSTDGGVSFGPQPTQPKYKLQHSNITSATPSGNQPFRNARIEMPSIVNGTTISLLQQYVDGATGCSATQCDTNKDRLMGFQFQIATP